jgi:hypothetical protein
MRRFGALLHAAALPACLLLGACSSSSNSHATGNPPADAGDAGGFHHDIVFTMSLTVPAYTELHKCQYVQLPAGADVNVDGFAHQYTAGSHHFLLYRTTLTSIPSGMTGQYDCTNGDEPIWQNATGIAYGAQTPSGAYTFPAGVAATLPAGGVLIMNTHFLNATANPIDTTVQMGLDTTTADKVHTQGGFFIFYDPFIDVPAMSVGHSGGRCSVPQDVNVLMAFTHYHYRGTGMEVWLDPNATTKTTMPPFYKTSDWQHPTDFTGPMTWPAASEVRFQCDYDNTDTTEVLQGPNAKTSEMCVLAGLYYPRSAQPDGFEQCDNYSVSGFGTNACLATATCLQACPASSTQPVVRTATGAIVDPCWQKCIAAACDGAFDTVLPLFSCVSSQCSTECSGGATTCQACASSKCATQFSACASQACP